MVAEVARRRDCLAGHDEGTLKTYLDGQLPVAWREGMETHVRECVSCKDRLARLRLDGALVQGRLLAIEPAAGAPGVAGSGAGGVANGALGTTPRPAVGALLARARRPVGWRERATAWWGDWAPAGGVTAGLRTVAGLSAAASSPAGSPSDGSRRSAWRPLPLAAGVAAGVALVLGVAAKQPAMQSFAQGALQQFRVQQVRPVQIDLTALRNLPPIDHGVAEAFFRSGTFSGLKDPKVSVVEPGAARRATGLTLRGIGTLPAQLKGKPTILLSEPASFTFTYDAQKLSRVAQEAGVKDAAVLTQLQSFDGVTVKGDVPAAAAVLYGNPFPDGIPSAARPSGSPVGASGAARAPRPPGALGALATPGAGTKPMATKPTGPAMVFVQLKSPSVSVPKDVDVDQLREQVLKAGVQSGAIPLALANELRMIDLQTTLPIPVTTGKATPVQVDGVTGTLVTGEGPGPVLIWQKGGALYLLGGVQVNEGDVLAAARSLPNL